MEISTTTKVDIIKPVVLKAGIPIAISVAGFVFARLATRKGSIVTAPSVENEANSHEKHRGEESSSVLESLDSSSSCCVEGSQHYCSAEEAHQQNSEVILIEHHKMEVEEEILCLRNRVRELQEKELELEAWYLRYHEMKEKEMVLMEVKNKLLMEISKVEFLDREIQLVETENRRFENMALEYLKIIKQLKISKSEKRLLHRRVKKLLRKTKKQSCVTKEQCLQIEAKEAEISRNCEELDKRANVIKKMENEIEEIKLALDRKEMEINELLNEIELANKAAESKMEVEGARVTDYNAITSELERLEKERADEEKELIYLRWCNACLRHQLLRRSQEEQEHRGETDQLDLHFGEIVHFCSDTELDSSSFGHGDSCLGLSNSGNPHSRRRKFVQKLKKWIEGSEKTKQRFGRHSATNSAGDLHIPARTSFSSAE